MDDFNPRVIELHSPAEAQQVLAAVGADRAGIAVMAGKALFHAVYVENVRFQAANILKQEMLSLGGEAAVHREVISGRVEASDVLLLGTVKQLRELVRRLPAQPFGLKKLAGELRGLLESWEAGPASELDCRGRRLPLGQRTLVMGILNVTPDSFSDGGRFLEHEAALQHARRLAEEGSDILDLGAESTRPGHQPVSEQEEMDRLLPVLEAVLQQVDLPVSVDTYKARVAEDALRLGAHIINDVWGGRREPQILAVAAKYSAPVILMHNQEGTQYHDLMGDLIRSMRESARMAEEAGVPAGSIILDPGIGFGKDTAQNLEVMRRLRELKSIGCPILLGTSRKSLIGNALGLPPDQRLEGTAATVALGIANGADIVRVHDVQAMLRVVRMTDAMVRRA